MTLIFSNNGNQRKHFFTPTPVELGNEAAVIANADANLFDNGVEFTPENYNLAADQAILTALNLEQNRRIEMARAESAKLPPRPRK